jgi:hypothetical protein
MNACVIVLRELVDKIDDLTLEDFVQTLVLLIEIKGKSTNPELLASLKSPILKLLSQVTLDSVRKIDSAVQDTSHYFHSYLMPIVKAYERLEDRDDVVTGSGSSILNNKTIRCISEAAMRQNGFYHMLNKRETFFIGFSTPLWFYADQAKLIRPLNMINLSKEMFNWYVL